jgi:ankyrin repeat protein
MNKGANPAVVDHQGSTALIRASALGNLEVINGLLSAQVVRPETLDIDFGVCSSDSLVFTSPNTKH